MSVARIIAVTAALLAIYSADQGAPPMSPTDLRADLAVAYRALAEGHAGFVRYVTADEMARARTTATSALSRPMRTMEFYRVLARVVGAVRCGHTELLLPTDIASQIAHHTPLLPVKLFVADTIVQVMRAYSSNPLLAGANVVSINGVPAGELVRSMTAVAHGDGFSATATARRLMDGFTFNELLYSVAGVAAPFEIIYRDERGAARRAVVAGKTGDDLRALEKQVHPSDARPTDAVALAYVPNTNVAILRISSFDEWADAARTRTTDAFIDSTFVALEARHVAALILDLRDNGGGDDGLARRLVAHLLAAPYRYYADLRMTSPTSPLFAKDERVDAAHIERDSVGVYHRLDHPGLEVQRPRAPVFGGAVIALVDGGTFSATAEALSILKEHGRVTLVGEEGGGGYAGNTSGFGASIVLPNSRLKLDIPRLSYEMAVSGGAANRGVMPDYPIRETVRDRMAHRDPVLDSALALARADTRARPPAGQQAAEPPADEFVVNAFRQHDIVFLGEMHSVRDNLAFLAALVPKLHAAHVYTLGFEFANYADQPGIDSVTNGARYDERRALQLLWHCCNLKWVTQEYADVFRAVWAFNQSLPLGARRFRILGLDRRSTDARGVAPSGQRLTNGLTDLPDSLTRLNSFDADNFFWSQVLDREVLQPGEKALVYTGEGHAYTAFIHSRGKDGGFSVGNFIYNAIHDRAFTINLHGSASDGRLELARAVDSIVARRVGPKRFFGFLTKGSAIGALPIREYGCTQDVRPRCDRLSLEDITDGYVYLAPVNAWRSVTFRPDFITPGNYADVEAAWRAEHPSTHPYTIDELRAQGEASMRRQFLYQQGRAP